MEKTNKHKRRGCLFLSLLSRAFAEIHCVLIHGQIGNPKSMRRVEKKSAHKEKTKKGGKKMMERRMEYFTYLGVMSESLKFKRISVNDSFARNSSQTLLGRFVFHAPTSFLTVPPLAFCLFNLFHSPSSQHTHTDCFSWLGLSEFHVVYLLMCLWVS